MAATKITVRTNGSIRLEGNFELCDHDGNPFDLAGRTSISLCRCGHSNDKPFCDGSHRAAGFTDEVRARALAPAQPKAL
jgi:CDGSH-type Zn-finger protein